MAARGSTGSAQPPALAGVLELQLPACLATAMAGYLAQRPHLSGDGLLQAALAAFLVQHGEARAEVRELYLDGLFSAGR